MSRHENKRGHHRSTKHGMHRWMKRNRKFFLSAVFFSMAVVIAGGFFLVQEQKKQSRLHVTAEHSVDMKGGHQTVTRQDKEYRRNAQSTAILFARTGGAEALQETAESGNDTCLEEISLIILDKKQKLINVLQIPSNMAVASDGTEPAGIVLQEVYSRETDAESGCEALVQAVSALIGGIPINEYVVADQNTGIHMPDYIETLKGKLKGDPNVLLQELQAMKQDLQTSITKNEYMQLAEFLETFAESETVCHELPLAVEDGEDGSSCEADEEALQQLILDLFYEEI